MNADQIENFRKMLAQLEGIHQEMGVALKKNPDKSASAFKVKFVNAVLKQASDVLGSSAPDIGFDGFDPDDLPTASDVSMVVTQFIECAEKVRTENIGRSSGYWFWKADGAFTNIPTAPPKGVK